MKVKLKDSQDETMLGVSNIWDLLNGMKKSGDDEALGMSDAQCTTQIC